MDVERSFEDAFQLNEVEEIPTILLYSSANCSLRVSMQYLIWIVSVLLCYLLHLKCPLCPISSCWNPAEVALPSNNLSPLNLFFIYFLYTLYASYTFFEDICWCVCFLVLPYGQERPHLHHYGSLSSTTGLKHRHQVGRCYVKGSQGHWVQIPPPATY